jgi:hypothetical protein
VNMAPLGTTPAPQVALLEEHVGHVMVAGVDDQALDQADVTVGGVDGFASVLGPWIVNVPGLG